ncbi:MAG: hypothetical protein MJZ34_00075 [Paludibacteraceae bacterium]|nr:hypothetical protein [Paludibacteraceae bacterium]
MELLPIESYLPQKHPFVFIEKMLDVDEKKCQGELTIKEENVLVQNGCFIESGILENIAQTCAAHIGYVEIHIRKNPNIHIGMVAQIKDMEIYRYPKVGETIITDVIEQENYGEVSIYNAKITSSAELIAEGEIRVVLTDKIG